MRCITFALLLSCHQFCFAAPQMTAVGDAGNAADALTGYGSVDYAYRIGVHEVTNSEYVAFLNAVAASDAYGLYNTSMTYDPVTGAQYQLGGITRSGVSGSYTYGVRLGYANKPVNYVSIWDAMRYANWLTSGVTESGVYALSSGAIAGNSVVRDVSVFNAGGYAVASENEWYKAAYYKGGSADAGYWRYAIQSDAQPIPSNVGSAAPGYANYNGMVLSAALTDVGAFSGSQSVYGTFDQNGNLWEMNDTIIGGTARGARGGAYGALTSADLMSVTRSQVDPALENVEVGFRITQGAIPETSAWLPACSAVFVAMVVRRVRVRKASRA